MKYVPSIVDKRRMIEIPYKIDRIKGKKKVDIKS